MTETLCDLFLRTIESFPKDEFMLHKKEGCYRAISTEEFARSVRHLSLGLTALGHRRGDRLVILAESSPRWVITDFANVCAGGVTVPIHAVLTPSQINHIINDSAAAIVVFSSGDLWAKLKAVGTDLAGVRHFITFEDTADEGVMTFNEVLEKGREREARHPEAFLEAAAAAEPGDLAAIIYTSGTTGIPKGAMLTHGNFMSNTVSASSLIEATVRDTVLSFLPLSHTLERIGMLAYFDKGCTIAFAENMTTLPQNLLEVRPHIMVSAPRIFEKIYAGIMNRILASSPVRRKLFFWAVRTGKTWGALKLRARPIPALLKFKRGLAQRLVFRKITALTGGRIRFFLSGGAPLAKDIAEFFYAIGLPILEGYGLTETSPIITLNTFEAMKFGSVGKPIPGVEVRIAADGEILTRGPHVMKGYHKMPAETEEVLEGDWFKTGDIGHFDEDGFLVITDRKKDIIVTSGGKNVAPQQIENLLKTSPYIANAVVLGDRRKFVSALVVPNLEKLEDYAVSARITSTGRSDLLQKRQIMDFLMTEVDRVTVDLASYEKVKKIALLDKDFEIDAGELTPTLKVKRSVIEKKYRDLIDALYLD